MGGRQRGEGECQQLGAACGKKGRILQAVGDERCKDNCVHFSQCQHFMNQVYWDWDKTSSPLVGKGKECKFIKPSDKFSSTEGENVFCTLDIVGDPAPTVTWFKASKDLSTEPRCKQWTNAPNQIILGFSKTKQEDEGEYRVEIENEHGMVEHVFSLYVTVAGGMDFRAMLMRKKKPAKKVVEKVEWIEEPVDRQVKQGTVDEVRFTA